MPIDARKLQVLHILSKNLLNPNTHLVNSNDIAKQLISACLKPICCSK